MWTPRGSEYSFCSPSSPTTYSLRIPLLISPYFTTPSISVITAVSRGLRASNSSTTRGRPPVVALGLVVARVARLEQSDKARQPAGDVFGLGSRARNLRQHVSGVNLIPIRHRQVSVHGHQVTLFVVLTAASGAHIN